jgi:hypothetical protein
MAFEPVTAAHRLAYKENVELAVQQKRSRFENYFTYQGNLSGRQMRVLELIGSTEARVDAERGGDTPHIEPRVEDVWLRPRRLDWGRLIEKEDTIKALIDYSAVAVQDGAAAIARGRDRIMAAAFFGPRIVGQDGSQAPEAYSNPNGNVPINYVKSGTAVNSGLTIPKLIRGLSILSAGEVDLEQDTACCAVTNIQMEDLYNSLQFTSKDFRDKAVFDDKERTVLSFMGITFVRWQGLPTVTGQATQRRIPLWIKSGMHYGPFSELETQLERNVNKNYRLHPYMETWVGATRSEDAKVVEIICSEV